MSWRSKVVQQREPCGSSSRVRADIVWAPGGLLEAQISHCRDPLLRVGQPCASSTPLQRQHLRVTHQRLLHLVLVSADLRGFVHAHPVHADSIADGPILFNVSVPLGPLAWRLEGAAVPPGCAAAKAADTAAPMFALRGTLAARANSPRSCPGLPSGPHTFSLLPSGRGGATGGGGVDGGATAAATATGAAGASGAGAVVLARGRAEGAPLEADVTCCEAAAVVVPAGKGGDAGAEENMAGDASGSAAEGGGGCYRARLFSVGAAVGAGVAAGGAWCETMGVEWRQVSPLGLG